MLMLVFAMMIGPWVINGWIAFSMLKQTRAKRFLPRNAMAGELVSIEIEVENRKWLLTSWLLAARDEIAHPRDRFQAAVLFVRIPAQQTRRGHYSVRFSQRGIYSFGPIELSTHFPLGTTRFGQQRVFGVDRASASWTIDVALATRFVERRGIDRTPSDSRRAVR
jgi:uncharacterized protein (DUF58 family)